MTIVVAVLFLGLLIFIHEVGHFVVAKLFGVDVLVLSFGFGRRLVGFWWRGTDYRLSLIPFGGYVRLRGADPYGDEDPDASDAYDERSVQAKPVWQRLLIYLAGPAFNLVLPYFIFVALLLGGEPQPASFVGTVLTGSPADLAGVRAGDRITHVNGVLVNTWEETLEAWEEAPDRSVLALSLERRGQAVELRIPAPTEGDGAWRRYGELLGVDNDVPSNEACVDDPRSPAGLAGLRECVRVEKVNGETTDDWNQVAGALEQAADRLDLTVSVDGVVSEVALARTADWPPVEAAPMGPPRNPWGLESASLFVDKVSAGSPAELAGLEAGDHLLAVDGRPVRAWAEVLTEVAATVVQEGEDGTAREVVVSVRRAGATMSVAITPRMTRDKDVFGRYYWRPVLGVTRLGAIGSGPMVRKYYPLGEALVSSGEVSFLLVRTTVEQIGRIITGEVAPQESLGGPVEIMRQASFAARAGIFETGRLLGMISISIGIFNLLPVPVLDGGHILFYLLEAVRGRPVSPALRERAQMVGVMLLVLLMLFVLVMDVRRLFTGG